MKYSRGRHPNSGFREGYTPWNKGKEAPSIGRKGRIPWNKGLKGFRAGEKRPNIMPKGEKHWSYKKDRTTLANKHERNDYSYQDWRKRVWERDNYKCKLSNEDCKGKIEAHHILGWTTYPKLRYELSNGITLCHFHHPRKRIEESRLLPIFTELLKT